MGMKDKALRAAPMALLRDMRPLQGRSLAFTIDVYTVIDMPTDLSLAGWIATGDFF